MARLARVEVFAADEIAIVHVMNRTVRRCFLPGDDPVSRKFAVPLATKKHEDGTFRLGFIIVPCPVHKLSIHIPI